MIQISGNRLDTFIWGLEGRGTLGLIQISDEVGGTLELIQISGEVEAH